MQIDFHYYCVGALARAAGFPSEEALTIAYASQYTDNATESEPIRLAGSSLLFDPVRTSHIGLQSLNWSTQKRVFIPFHFIPPHIFQPLKEASFSFVTEPDSQFANWLLEQASKDTSGSPKRRLCRIGIAVHTYADSWAHQGFSGRHNRDENDVENIRSVKPGGTRYRHLKFANVIFDTLPQIGHAEAGPFPDIAYLRWKYDSRNCRDIQRHNPQEFLQAAERIYRHFRKMSAASHPVISWDELRPTIQALLLGAPKREAAFHEKITPEAYNKFYFADVQHRCQAWKKEFRGVFGPLSAEYDYDPERWRQEAFFGDTDWDDFTPREWRQAAPFRSKANFWDSSWVHFHRAALLQRHLVLENMP